MKIIYRQPAQDTLPGKITLLEQLGISGCHLKLIKPSQDARSITPRAHHHTGCELHLVTKGTEHYLVEGEKYTVPENTVLLIPPGTTHQHLFSETDTEKYSVIFASAGPVPTHLVSHLCSRVICIQLWTQSWEVLAAIRSESSRRKEYSAAVMECRLFELLLTIARNSGFREETMPDIPQEDSRVSMARQYVLDNIDRPITCPELADYCHLSQKQLTRLFLGFTGKTPAAYIRNQKVLRIQELLADPQLSLKQISVQLHFASVCHFCSFFTKYAGMTPGAYRKMSNPTP